MCGPPTKFDWMCLSQYSIKKLLLTASIKLNWRKLNVDEAKKLICLMFYSEVQKSSRNVYSLNLLHALNRKRFSLTSGLHWIFMLPLHRFNWNHYHYWFSPIVIVHYYFKTIRYNRTQLRRIELRGERTQAFNYVFHISP